MMILTRKSISNLPAVEFDGMWRVLGCIPSDPNADFPLFAAAHSVLPRSEWREIDLEHYNLPIKDQAMSSACVGHGCSSAMEMAWVQGGRPLAKLSAWFLYGLINGGRDAGAMISDALTSLQNTGDCPDEDVPQGMMFKQQFPQKSFDNAKRFKILQAYKCRNFDEICSAITLGFPTPLGILVGSNFPQVDSEVVCPLPNGGGGGHCILGMGLRKSTKYGWVIKIQNSWGPRFGKNGHAYIREEHFRSMNPDAFAIQALFDDPQDNTPADEVPVALEAAHEEIKV